MLTIDVKKYDNETSQVWKQTGTKDIFWRLGQIRVYAAKLFVFPVSYQVNNIFENLI